MIQNLFKKMKTERLSAVERAEIKDVLVARMHQSVPTYREYSWMRLLFTITRHRSLMYSSVLLLVVFAGGGLSYTASSALPGNPLYGMKVDILEPLREAFTFSDESKVLLQAEFAQNRLSEASMLASEGKLNDSIKEELFTKAAQRTAAFRSKISESESIYQEDVINAAARLSSSIDEHLLLADKTFRDTSMDIAPVQAPASLQVQSSQNTVQAPAVPRLRTASDELEREVFEKQLNRAREENEQATEILKERLRLKSGKIDNGGQLFENQDKKPEEEDVVPSVVPDQSSDSLQTSTTSDTFISPVDNGKGLEPVHNLIAK